MDHQQNIELLNREQQHTLPAIPLNTQTSRRKEIWIKIRTILRIVIVTIIVLVFVFATIRQLIFPASNSINTGASRSNELLNKMITLLEAIDGDIRFAPLIAVQARSMPEWNQTVDSEY